MASSSPRQAESRLGTFVYLAVMVGVPVAVSLNFGRVLFAAAASFLAGFLLHHLLWGLRVARIERRRGLTYRISRRPDVVYALQLGPAPSPAATDATGVSNGLPANDPYLAD
jgi:hypothetical protein